jgi:hypothetical protein
VTVKPRIRALTWHPDNGRGGLKHWRSALQQE